MSSVEELISYSHKCYKKGFVSATDGNLSIRLSENKIAITKSGICKEDVTRDDIVITDTLGNKLEGNGKPSSEIKIHLLAYNSRRDINAVIHCHPIYATAFATSGRGLTQPIFPEVILGLGPVPLCKYGTPSTEELPNSMKPFINNSWAILLQNHGAVTFGESILDAFNRMDKLESSSKTLFLAKLLGNETILTKAQVDKLYQIAELNWGTKPLSKFYEEFEIDKKNLSNLRPNLNNTNFLEIIEERLKARAGNKKLSDNIFVNYYDFKK